MTMPERIFDPQTHRFGMAYICDTVHGKATAYPLYDSVCHYRWHDGDYTTGPTFENLLTRSPEHDLIPRAAAEKLRMALENVLSDFEEHCHWPQGKPYPSGVIFAQRAITEFDTEYGGKNDTK